MSTSRVSVSRLGTRALPPRRPKETKPSRVRQISRVRPTLAPRRVPRNPVAGKRDGVDMFATATTSCAATSMRWGRPDARPVSAANAVSAAAWLYPAGSAQRTGARSGSPVQYRLPLAAMMPRSVARHDARGPSSPKGVRLTQTASGASAGDRSQAPGKPGVSSTTAARPSSSANAGSSAPVTGSRTARWVHASKRWGRARSGSPPGPSGRTTSAPRSARIRPAIAPGSPVRSATSVPASSVCGVPDAVPDTGVTVLTARG